MTLQLRAIVTGINADVIIQDSILDWHG